MVMIPSWIPTQVTPMPSWTQRPPQGEGNDACSPILAPAPAVMMGANGSSPVLLIQKVSKRYAQYRRPSDRLIEAFSQTPRHTAFWALRDVSLSVPRGQFLAIVGPNGSGKSTLLQIVAGIVEPTSGRVVRQGRVAALLELGAGFNPEFTGRDNVLLNA